MSHETHERPVRSQEQFCTHEWFVNRQWVTYNDVEGKKYKYSFPLHVISLKCFHCGTVENITL